MSLPDPLLAALARLAASRGLAPPDRVLAASVPVSAVGPQTGPIGPQPRALDGRARRPRPQRPAAPAWWVRD